MPAIDYPAPIQRLILQLKSLPGLGPRSAERLAVWLMTHGADRAETLGEQLRHLRHDVEACPECGFFMEKGATCLLCGNEKRNAKLMCVVEQASDILRLERSGAFHGLYHVLGGKRIVHIGQVRGGGWAAQIRSRLHTSHMPHK